MTHSLMIHALQAFVLVFGCLVVVGIAIDLLKKTTWKGQTRCIRCGASSSSFFRSQWGVTCGNCGKDYEVR